MVTSVPACLSLRSRDRLCYLRICRWSMTATTFRPLNTRCAIRYCAVHFTTLPQQSIRCVVPPFVPEFGAQWQLCSWSAHTCVFMEFYDSNCIFLSIYCRLPITPLHLPGGSANFFMRPLCTFATLHRVKDSKWRFLKYQSCFSKVSGLYSRNLNN